jgi:ABC-type phosphate transport system substrate-binding protein
MRWFRCIGSTATAIALALAASSAGADIVAVVSARSPITTLTRLQVVDIFLGKRTRFPDGSSGVPIDQIEGAAREEFYARFADMSPAQLKAFWSRIIFTGRGQPPLAAASGREAKQLLLANPYAIGYVDQSMVDSSLRVVVAP